jgi:hypothetical protein
LGTQISPMFQFFYFHTGCSVPAPKLGWGALQKLVIEFSMVCPCGRNPFVTHSGLDYTAFKLLVKGF